MWGVAAPANLVGAGGVACGSGVLAINVPRLLCVRMGSTDRIVRRDKPATRSTSPTKADRSAERRRVYSKCVSASAWPAGPHELDQTAEPATSRRHPVDATRGTVRSLSRGAVRELVDSSTVPGARAGSQSRRSAEGCAPAAARNETEAHLHSFAMLLPHLPACDGRRGYDGCRPRSATAAPSVLKNSFTPEPSRQTQRFEMRSPR